MVTDTRGSRTVDGRELTTIPMSSPALVTICVDYKEHRYMFHMRADQFSSMPLTIAMSMVCVVGRLSTPIEDKELFKDIYDAFCAAKQKLLKQNDSTSGTN